MILSLVICFLGYSDFYARLLTLFIHGSLLPTILDSLSFFLGTFGPTFNTLTFSLVIYGM